MNLNDLRSFVRAVELGAFTSAAREEGVPRSTIARRVARLESALGVDLVRRSPRSFVPTDDGKRLFQLAGGAFRDIAHAIDALQSAATRPTGKLVISVPDLGRSEAFADLLVRFRNRFPDVELDVRIENRVIDLRAEGVDVAFRAYTTHIPGGSDLMSRVFPLPRVGIYASPGYLEKRGVPDSPADLRDHTHIGHLDSVGMHRIKLRTSAETVVVDLKPPSLRANDMLLVRSLAEAGGGLGLLPIFLISAAVERGQLVRVLPQWWMSEGRIALLWPSSRHLAPRVRAFVDFAVDFLARW